MKANWFFYWGLGFALLTTALLVAGEWGLAPISVYGAYIFGGKAIREG
jgi:hypothetical protein